MSSCVFLPQWYMYQAYMDRYFRRILIFMIAIETIAISYILFEVFTLIRPLPKPRTAEVVDLNRDFLVSSPSATLKYFYEYRPDTMESDTQPWLPYTAIYTYNHDGLNERYNYDVVKPKDTFRIMTLGDSFTFGYHVSTPENWPERLEDRLGASCTAEKHYEVINLAAAGYDVRYIAQRYGIRGKKYNPDLIIWLESGSGFDRIQELMAQYVQLLGHQSSAALPPETIKSPDGRITNIMYERVMNEIHTRYTSEQLSAQIVAAWKQFLDERGETKTVIAMFTSEPLINKLKLGYWMLGQKNIWIDSDVSSVTKGIFTLPDTHPSPIGHEKIASDLFAYILQNKLVPCR